MISSWAGKLLFLIATIVAMSGSALGQENRSHNIDNPPSALLRKYGLELSLSRPMTLIPANPTTDEPDFSISLRQSLTQAGQLSMEPYNYGDRLQSIWKQELIRQNEYRTLRNILGSVQVGAVAYMTYLRLKRYGLK